MNASELQLITQYIAAYNAFDVDRMLAFIHHDVHFENWSGGQLTFAIDGHRAFRRLAESAYRVFSERQQDIVGIQQVGDAIEIQIQYTAIPIQNLSAEIIAGERFSMAGKSIFRFQDGLIVFLRDQI